MSLCDDLPLFGWRASISATVIPFPAGNRVGKIRRTAEILISSTNKAADYHWRRTVDDMTRQMERAGLDDGTIQEEIGNFQTCVQAEMSRITRRPCRPGGDVA